jgi:hypothetical protein
MVDRLEEGLAKIQRKSALTNPNWEATQWLHTMIEIFRIGT